MRRLSPMRPGRARVTSARRWCCALGRERTAAFSMHFSWRTLAEPNVPSHLRYLRGVTTPTSGGDVRRDLRARESPVGPRRTCSCSHLCSRSVWPYKPNKTPNARPPKTEKY
jgi:hypothetical protein